MIVQGRERLRQYILSNYNQLDILSMYLNVPISTLENAIITKSDINNPLRIDHHPSLGIYQKVDKDGMMKVRIWDWAAPKYRGDIFDVVGILIGKNPTKNTDFILICDEIIKAVKAGSPTPTYFNTRNRNQKLDNFSKEIKVFDIWTRKWTAKDKKYWSRINLSPEELEASYVYPISQAAIDTRFCYYYTANDPCFAFWLGVYQGVDLYKLYFPFRTKDNSRYSRFITNNPLYLEGLNFLKKAPNLIITKARKDAILIQKVISFLNEEDNFQVTSITSESAILPSKIVDGLYSVYDNIFTNFDFDSGGILSSAQHRREYGFIPLTLTNGRANSKDYGAKDFSDYVSKYGYTEGLKLAQLTLNYINEILISKEAIWQTE